MATGNHFTHLGRYQHLPSAGSSSRSTTQGVRASTAGTSSAETTTAPDLRRVLGVGPNASTREVKTAYRRLVLQFHPDVCKGETCDVRFLEINRAYESLMNLLGSSSSNQTPSSREVIHSNYTYNQQPKSSSRSEDDDPWADFLQSLVTGTYEEQLSSANSNTGNSTRTSTSSSFEGSW